MSLKKRIAAAAAAAVVGVALVWGSTSGALFSDEQTATVNGDVGTTDITLDVNRPDGECVIDAVSFLGDVTDDLVPGGSVAGSCRVTNIGSTPVTITVYEDIAARSVTGPNNPDKSKLLVSALPSSADIAPGAYTNLGVTLTLPDGGPNADNDWQDASVVVKIKVHADQKIS